MDTCPRRVTSLTRKSHHARAPMTKPNIPAWAYTTTCVSPSMPRSRDHCWNTSGLGVGKGNSGDLGRSWNTLRYTAPGMWALEGEKGKEIKLSHYVMSWRNRLHIIGLLNPLIIDGPVIGFRSDFSQCVNIRFNEKLCFRWQEVNRKSPILKRLTWYYSTIWGI